MFVCVFVVICISQKCEPAPERESAVHPIVRPTFFCPADCHPAAFRYGAPCFFLLPWGAFVSGKQWWPLTATADESRAAITRFQDRLRDRQWLRDREAAQLLYIAFVDSHLPIDHVPSVNDLMRFSSSDGPLRNQERVATLRLLCMLLKWHITMRPGALLAAPPAVFTVPDLETGGYRHGLIAPLRTADSPGRPFSILVSEAPLAPPTAVAAGGFRGPGTIRPASGPRARFWAMPQSGDTRHWMTVRTWQEQRAQPSWGKWVFGSAFERRSWLETLATPADLAKAGLVLFPMDRDAAPATSSLDPARPWPAFRTDFLRKELGGAWWRGATVLPEFWDPKAAAAVLSALPVPAEPPRQRAPYRQAAAAARTGSAPAHSSDTEFRDAQGSSDRDDESGVVDSGGRPDDV
jgi:hypothetical protein